MADYVDPWSGLKAGVQTLRDASNSALLQDRQRMQNETAQMDLDMKRKFQPQTEQLMAEDITTKLNENTLQQIGALAQASNFVRGNPSMAKEIGTKMGVNPDILMNIKQPRPDMYTLNTDDGNTVVVVRDDKDGLKVMKTTDPQLAQKHQYKMDEINSRMQMQLANTLAGIAARGAQKQQGSSNDLSPEDMDLIVQATQHPDPNKRLPISQLSKSSRGNTYMKIIAEGLRRDPDFDYMSVINKANIAKSPVMANKALPALSMPAVLKATADAGAALNFPEFKLAGDAKAFYLKHTNDPDFVRYMTLRNDAVQAIAGVMKGAGATREATRLEEEAAAISMSPKATMAWLNAQMESLEPRLKAYKKIYGGMSLIDGEKGTQESPAPATEKPSAAPAVTPPTAPTTPTAVPQTTAPVQLNTFKPAVQSKIKSLPVWKSAPKGATIKITAGDGTVMNILKDE